MNPQNPRTDRAWRHARAVYLWRLRQVLRTIPKDADGDQLLQWRLYAMRIVAMLGAKQLAGVIWPWQPRYRDAGRGTPRPGQARRRALAAQRPRGRRTPRGRASNPTAL
ncbi:MAG: hypothetical protein IPK75_17780 [Acidobacteria bacterium]|nr:hypothetical protein [Acidobacteriota bacterium]